MAKKEPVEEPIEELQLYNEHGPVSQSGTQVVAATRVAKIPDRSWSLDQLQTHAVTTFGEWTMIARRMAQTSLAIGTTLKLIQKQMDRKGGGFRGWCEDNGISKSTAYRLIGFAELAKSAERIDGMTEAEVIAKYRIAPTRTEAPATKPTFSLPSKLTGTKEETKHVLTMLDDLTICWDQKPELIDDQTLADALDKLQKSLFAIQKIRESHQAKDKPNPSASPAGTTVADAVAAGMFPPGSVLPFVTSRRSKHKGILENPMLGVIVEAANNAKSGLNSTELKAVQTVMKLTSGRAFNPGSVSAAKSQIAYRIERQLEKHPDKFPKGLTAAHLTEKVKSITKEQFDVLFSLIETRQTEHFLTKNNKK